MQRISESVRYWHDAANKRAANRKRQWEIEMTTTISNVRLCWDATNKGWFTRHDEHTESGDELNRGCDNGLDASDRDNVDEALDEAVKYFGGKVSREEIEILTH